MIASKLNVERYQNGNNKIAGYLKQETSNATQFYAKFVGVMVACVSMVALAFYLHVTPEKESGHRSLYCNDATFKRICAQMHLMKLTDLQNMMVQHDYKIHKSGGEKNENDEKLCTLFQNAISYWNASLENLQKRLQRNKDTLDKTRKNIIIANITRKLEAKDNKLTQNIEQVPSTQTSTRKSVIGFFKKIKNKADMIAKKFKNHTTVRREEEAKRLAQYAVIYDKYCDKADFNFEEEELTENEMAFKEEVETRQSRELSIYTMIDFLFKTDTRQVKHEITKCFPGIGYRPTTDEMELISEESLLVDYFMKYEKKNRQQDDLQVEATRKEIYDRMVESILVGCAYGGDNAHMFLIVDWFKALRFYRKIKADETKMCYVSDKTINRQGGRASLQNEGCGLYILNKEATKRRSKTADDKAEVYEQYFFLTPIKMDGYRVLKFPASRSNGDNMYVIEGELKQGVQKFHMMQNKKCKSFQTVNGKRTEIKNFSKGNKFRLLSTIDNVFKKGDIVNFNKMKPGSRIEVTKIVFNGVVPISYTVVVPEAMLLPFHKQYEIAFHST